MLPPERRPGLADAAPAPLHAAAAPLLSEGTIHIYIYIYIYIYICIYVYIYIYIYICIYTYTCIYIYIYIYIHVCIYIYIYGLYTHVYNAALHAAASPLSGRRGLNGHYEQDRALWTMHYERCTYELWMITFIGTTNGHYDQRAPSFVQLIRCSGSPIAGRNRFGSIRNSNSNTSNSNTSNTSNRGPKGRLATGR